MQDLGRRGISGVVATVLLILLSMAAVGIIWVAISQFAKSPQLSPEVQCSSFQYGTTIYIERACYDATNNEVEITIKRGISGDFDIQSLGFVIYSDKDSASWRCDKNCLDCKIVDLGNSKTYYFDVSGLGTPRSAALMANSCNAGSATIGSC